MTKLGISSGARYFFCPQKKGVRTLPPRARVRNLTFVEAATDLNIPARAFETVLGRFGYHYRRYHSNRCVESIRLRLFNLAYRIDRHCNRGSKSAAANSYTQGIFERKLGLNEYVSTLHARPSEDRGVRVIDIYIASILLNFPEFGFTREIIDDALARSVPQRIAPSRKSGLLDISGGRSE